MLKRAAAAALCALLGTGSLAAQQLAVVRFGVASRAALDSVRRLGVDIVEVHARADRGADVVAVVAERERGLLAARGLVLADVQRAPEVTALESQRALRGPAAFTVYRDFDDPTRGLKAYLRSLPGAHAGVAVDSIGASFEGRPILAVKVGPAGDDPGRANVIFLATYHAREWASTEMALRLALWLADSLPNRPGGAFLLANRDIWVIPVANPDGYQFTFSTERLWRKNRQPNANGTFGVDLNRNHNGFWGFDDAGSSGVPNSEVYRGPSVASAPEVQVIEAFHRAHPPHVAVSYHTYTGTVLYPWSHANGIRTGDDAIFRALAGTDVTPAIYDSIPGSVNRYYHPGPGWNLYEVNGDYTSYAYRAFRAAAFTVELTSGCCVGAGGYYGFEFPDSEPMLDRMFRDNLPFALGLVAAAGNATQSTIPPGALPASVQLESIWPDLRALIDIPAPPGGAAVDVATDSGVVSLVFAQRDTLGNGRRFVRMGTSARQLDEQRATRMPVDGVGAEILMRDGAEHTATGWTGFRREAPGYKSDEAWRGYRDTLLSPSIPVQGRTSLTLFFWTKHFGSVFAQEQRGRIEVSGNDGASWTMVGQVVGAGPEWYPLAIPLGTTGAGASSLRLRFIAEGLDWLIDAVSLGASDPTITRLFVSRSGGQAQALEINANPATAAPLILRWTPAAGTARVDVFSATGTRVAGITMAVDPGRWQWDLVNDAGARIANGAYYLVLTLGDGTRIRRRVLVAR